MLFFFNVERYILNFIFKIIIFIFNDVTNFPSTYFDFKVKFTLKQDYIISFSFQGVEGKVWSAGKGIRAAVNLSEWTFDWIIGVAGVYQLCICVQLGCACVGVHRGGRRSGSNNRRCWYCCVQPHPSIYPSIWAVESREPGRLWIASERERWYLVTLTGSCWLSTTREA